jgi:hypothetical protein
MVFTSDVVPKQHHSARYDGTGKTAPYSKMQSISFSAGFNHVRPQLSAVDWTGMRLATVMVGRRATLC